MITMEENRPRSVSSVSSVDNLSSPSETRLSAESKKPSAPLSFSIARLINSAADQVKPASSAPEDLPSAGPSASLKNPIYPIPMWPHLNQVLKPQTAAWPFQANFINPPFQAPVSADANFQQMLRTLLQHSGFPPETMATLVRHYQQMYNVPPPPLLAQQHLISNAANLHIQGVDVGSSMHWLVKRTFAFKWKGWAASHAQKVTACRV